MELTNNKKIKLERIFVFGEYTSEKNIFSSKKVDKEIYTMICTKTRTSFFCLSYSSESLGRLKKKTKNWELSVNLSLSTTLCNGHAEGQRFFYIGDYQEQIQFLADLRCLYRTNRFNLAIVVACKVHETEHYSLTLGSDLLLRTL